MAKTAYIKFGAVIIIIVAFVSVAGIANHFYHRDLKWRAAWSERDAQDVKRQKEAETLKGIQEAENRERERQQAAQSQKTVQRLQDEAKAAQNRADAAISDYRNGVSRLRERFRCAVRATSEADPAATAAAVRDGTSACGLGSADVEFFVRYGNRAQQLAAQLTAAQLVLCGYYEAVNHTKLDYEVCRDGSTNRDKPQ